MKNIVSKIDGRLVCALVDYKEISTYRMDVSPEEEFIQVGARKLAKGIHVQKHKHKRLERITTNTQEAWVVIEGEIKAEVFDLDNHFLEEIVITKGGCAVFYRGGHSLTCLQDNTIFYEIKNGPYYGYDIDKEEI